MSELDRKEPKERGERRRERASKMKGMMIGFKEGLLGRTRRGVFITQSSVPFERWGLPNNVIHRRRKVNNFRKS
jgi:hypothetical protein